MLSSKRDITTTLMPNAKVIVTSCIRGGIWNTVNAYGAINTFLDDISACSSLAKYKAPPSHPPTKTWIPKYPGINLLIALCHWVYSDRLTEVRNT